jgi:phenylpyruvate tautomerase PptA (4-oxalocrotonate tautomerase family)
MPFVEITTSAALRDPDRQRALLRQVSHLVAEHLAKPVDYVMVQLTEGVVMAFAGSTEPCARVGVHGIGAPTVDQTGGLTQALCAELESALGVASKRIFVVFTPVARELWGLDGRMLG